MNTVSIDIDDYPKVIDNGRRYCVCSDFLQTDGKTSFNGFPNDDMDSGRWSVIHKDDGEYLESGKKWKKLKNVIIESDYNIQYIEGKEQVDWRASKI